MHTTTAILQRLERTVFSQSVCGMELSHTDLLNMVTPQLEHKRELKICQRLLR